MHAFLADLLVALHLAIVLFVIGAQVAIVAGGIRRWAWVRNLLFRLVHLALIVVVAGQAVIGVPCPLTVWEQRLRSMAGQTVETDISFVGRLLRDILFVEASPRVLTIVYVAFALIVAGSMILVPPRGRKGAPTG